MKKMLTLMRSCMRRNLMMKESWIRPRRDWPGTRLFRFFPLNNIIHHVTDHITQLYYSKYLMSVFLAICTCTSTQTETTQIQKILSLSAALSKIGSHLFSEACFNCLQFIRVKKRCKHQTFSMNSLSNRIILLEINLI